MTAGDVKFVIITLRKLRLSDMIGHPRGPIGDGTLG